jgi:hypothetical protein
MKATAGSAARSEAATSAAAPALARRKCTEERTTVDGDVAGGAAPARAGGDGASLRAPRMAMAVSLVFQSCLFLFPSRIAVCPSALSVLCCCLCLGLVSQTHDSQFSKTKQTTHPKKINQ